MNLSLLKRFVCPACSSNRLILRDAKSVMPDQIESGFIECQNCSNVYPIIRGMPRFVSASNYAETFGFQWNRHAQTQLDSYSGLPISRNRVFEVTRWKPDLRGECILEAGSGAGRFTEVLLGTGAEVVSFDYSAAVDANNKNNGSNRNLNLFQGDIFNIPLEKASFEKVFCLGVLQHTPDPAAAFASLASYVRPGGVLVVDVYTCNFTAWMQWKYLLRPLTKRFSQQTLYGLIETLTPLLVPVAKLLRRIGGRAGARLVPIIEYSHLGLPPELNRQWAILDTFDMYSPAHDHPQSLADVRGWFESAGFTEIDIRYGPNGVVGTGKKPGKINQ